MSHKKRYLVTMALPYANGEIHLGHLLEAVQTDVFVRFQKLCGNEAVYVCADDTHGTPIELSALKRNIAPEVLIAEAYENHKRDYAAFNIDFDIFYSTNSPENRRYAELIYDNLKKSDLVVEKEIDQYYCEHDRRFLPDRFIVGTCPKCKAPRQYGDVCEGCGATYDPTDLIEPTCIICSKPPVMRKSTHFYVELSKCTGFLRDYIHREGVLQDDMRNFVMSWINDGLREWCISRDGPYFGFRIPGTADKYFYVWLDAPIGYISSTERWCVDNNRSVEEFWGHDADCEVIHVIGKDIVYFHTLFWPVMLRSSSFALPKRFFVHGFVTVQGEKMSKSRGTFILAHDFIEKIKHPQAAEFLRFYYSSKLMPNSGDLDFNVDEFVNRVNTILANNIGNLHHRTAVFCDRYFDSTVPDASWDERIMEEVATAAIAIKDHFDKGEFKIVVEKLQALGNLGNKYYQDSKPWELIKNNSGAAAVIIVTCVNLIKALAVFLKPMVPSIAAKVEHMLGVELSWDDARFSLRNIKLGETEKLVQPMEPAMFQPLLPEPVDDSVHNHHNGAVAGQKNENGLIDITTFRNVELRVATVVAAEPIKGSEKLLKLQVEIGDEKRQVVAGIAKQYAPNDVIGKQVIVVANLQPATLFGEVSFGMVLAASDRNGKLVFITPEKTVASGSRVA